VRQRYLELIRDLDAGRIQQWQFLDALYNLAGPFQVQRHNLDEQGLGNPTRFTDWMKVREWRYRDTYNHRNICQCEIIFELDIPAWLNEEERLQTLRMTLRRLWEKYRIEPVVLDTGKGYHCHYFDPILMSMFATSDTYHQDKQAYAQDILMDIRTDMMKWNELTMIAIECSSHWKRGNKIKLIDESARVSSVSFVKVSPPAHGTVVSREVLALAHLTYDY